MPGPSPEVASLAGTFKVTKRWHGPDHEKTIAARRDLEAQKLAEHIARVVAEAPELTPEQVDRLASLLRPAAGRP